VGHVSPLEMRCGCQRPVSSKSRQIRIPPLYPSSLDGMPNQFLDHVVFFSRSSAGLVRLSLHVVKVQGGALIFLQYQGLVHFDSTPATPGYCHSIQHPQLPCRVAGINKEVRRKIIAGPCVRSGTLSTSERWECGRPLLDLLFDGRRSVSHISCSSVSKVLNKKCLPRVSILHLIYLLVGCPVEFPNLPWQRLVGSSVTTSPYPLFDTELIFS
jgi:hypothetical protein